MIYHVLNGDALIERFLLTGIGDQVVVARECLVEGSLNGDSHTEFYRTRARYIEGRYGEAESNYYTRVVSEFQKLMQAPDGSEFNLWFGYDLFCQVNLWYIFSLLNDLKRKLAIYLVYPSYLTGNNIWDDFGNASPEDLRGCYTRRLRVDSIGTALGSDLWTAYKHADFARLEELSRTNSPYFPHLKEVCEAHLLRFPAEGDRGRPEKVVEQMLKDGVSDFNTVFRMFSQTEGIYGFSDLQVKQIYEMVKTRLSDL